MRDDSHEFVSIALLKNTIDESVQLIKDYKTRLAKSCPKTELEKAEHRIRELNKQIDELRAKVLKVEAEASKKTGLLQAKIDNVSTLFSELHRFTVEVIKTCVNDEFILQELTQKIGKLTDYLRAQIPSATDSTFRLLLSQISTIIQRALNESANSEVQIRQQVEKKMAGDFKQLRSEHEKCSQRIKDLENEKNELKKQIEQLNFEKDRKNRTIDTLVHLHDKIGKAFEIPFDSESYEKDILRKIEQMSTTLASKRGTIDTLNILYLKLNDKFDKQKAELISLQAQKDELENKNNTISQEYDALKETTDQLKRELESQNSTISKLQEPLKKELNDPVASNSDFKSQPAKTFKTAINSFFNGIVNNSYYKRRKMNEENVNDTNNQTTESASDLNKSEKTQAHQSEDEIAITGSNCDDFIEHHEINNGDIEQHESMLESIAPNSSRSGRADTSKSTNRKRKLRSATKKFQLTESDEESDGAIVEPAMRKSRGQRK